MAIKVQEFNFDITKYASAESWSRVWMAWAILGFGVAPFMDWYREPERSGFLLFGICVLMLLAWGHYFRFDGTSLKFIEKLGVPYAAPIFEFFGGRPRFFKQAGRWHSGKKSVFYLQYLGFDGKTFCVTVGNKALFFTREDIRKWDWRIEGYSTVTSYGVASTISERMAEQQIRLENFNSQIEAYQKSGLFIFLKSVEHPQIQFCTTDKDTLGLWDEILTQATETPEKFGEKPLIDPAPAASRVRKPTFWRNLAIVMVVTHLAIAGSRSSITPVLYFAYQDVLSIVGKEMREAVPFKEVPLWLMSSLTLEAHLARGDTRETGSRDALGNIVCRPPAKKTEVVTSAEIVYYKFFGIESDGLWDIKTEEMCIRPRGAR
jgi:hypothetical protein